MARITRNGTRIKYIGTPPPATSLRPKCPGCDKPLRPNMTVREWGSIVNGSPRIVEWSGNYEGYGFFCTLRCGCKFANRIIRQRIEERKRHGA